MKFNLGCGARPTNLPGWTNIDTEDAKQGYKGKVVKGNILDLSNLYEDGCASEILCQHTVEHLDKNEIKLFFAECCRLLKPNGIMRLSAPDFEWAITVGLDKHDIDFLDNLLYARHLHKYDYHKQGIYEKKLRRLCQEYNFTVSKVTKSFVAGIMEIQLEAIKN